jgi:hypothetical protein
VFLLGTAHITTQAARLHLFRNSRGGKLTTLQGLGLGLGLGIISGLCKPLFWFI